MKGPIRNKGGFSLLEVVVSIALLGLMAAPICSSLVLSHRLNAESEKTLQARLKVESAVEQLMAEGIQYEFSDSGEVVLKNIVIDGVVIEVEDSGEDGETTKLAMEPWYTVKVSTEGIEVTTVIRSEEYVPSAQEGGDGT